jgi:hypothetical protein
VLSEMAVTQTFDRNVRGMAFGSLPALFQAVNDNHFAGQDLLGERGHRASYGNGQG